MSGKLYLLPTPVGNLEDITLRALRLLKEMDFILAEDTRQTLKLLKHYEIKSSLISYHKFNEHKSTVSILQRIQSGENAALVSDGGTPGISDPGFLIVRECIKEGVEVECLPGATAFVPALVNSGLPNDRFVFEGFLPHKKGRNKRLNSLKDESRTMIFYESPFRLIKTLHDFSGVFGEDRQASVSRELTKIYEETIRGTISEILCHYRNKFIKGEIVIIVAGKQ